MSLLALRERTIRFWLAAIGMLGLVVAYAAPIGVALRPTARLIDRLTAGRTGTVSWAWILGARLTSPTFLRSPWAVVRPLRPQARTTAQR